MTRAEMLEQMIAKDSAEIDRLRAENARLREALDAVAYMAEGAIRLGLTDELAQIKDTAQQALANETPTA